MTQHVGETYIIDTTATGYYGEQLDVDDVNSVTITILNRDATVQVDEAAMVWNATIAKWQYVWNTVGLEPGTYRYRVLIVGVDGRPNFEWKRTRLKKVPTVVT